MNHEQPEDLTPDERRAFEEMAQPVIPPAECEDRIVQELRARQLVRDTAPVTPAVVVPFRRRVLRVFPRVALAAAALAGAFFVGAEYGRDSVSAPGAPAVLLDDASTTEEPDGEMFKNADGEMVASVSLETQGYRPDWMLARATAGKPPIDRESDSGAFPGYPLDGTETGFSYRYP